MPIINVDLALIFIISTKIKKYAYHAKVLIPFVLLVTVFFQPDVYNAKKDISSPIPYASHVLHLVCPAPIKYTATNPTKDTTLL